MERSKNLIVKNRSASMVVYSLPELNVRREFMPGESKTITFGELEKLSYQPGGRSIMQNFLQIIDDKISSLKFDTDYSSKLSKHPAESSL